MAGKFQQLIELLRVRFVVGCAGIVVPRKWGNEHNFIFE